MRRVIDIMTAQASWIGYAAAALTGFVIFALTALQFTPRPESQILEVQAAILGLASPVIMSLVMLLRMEQVHSATSDVATRVADVQDKVNGQMSDLISRAANSSASTHQIGG